jgi:hypothetical protein
VNYPGYVAHSPDAPPITKPQQIDLRTTHTERGMPPRLYHSAKIAAKEVYRQGGISGFFRGSSVIPLVRIPIMAFGCGVSMKFMSTLFPRLDAMIDPFNHSQKHWVL